MDQVKKCTVIAEDGEVLLECGGAIATLTPQAARETGGKLHDASAKADWQTISNQHEPDETT